MDMGNIGSGKITLERKTEITSNIDEKMKSDIINRIKWVEREIP